MIISAEINLRRKSYLMATTETASESDDDVIKVETVQSRRFVKSQIASVCHHLIDIPYYRTRIFYCFITCPAGWTIS